MLIYFSNFDFADIFSFLILQFLGYLYFVLQVFACFCYANVAPPLRPIKVDIIFGIHFPYLLSNFKKFSLTYGWPSSSFGVKITGEHISYHTFEIFEELILLIVKKLIVASFFLYSMQDHKRSRFGLLLLFLSLTEWSTVSSSR